MSWPAAFQVSLPSMSTMYCLVPSQESKARYTRIASSISGSKSADFHDKRRSSSHDVTCDPRRPIFQYRIFAASSGSADSITWSPTRRSVSGTPALQITASRARTSLPGYSDRCDRRTPAARNGDLLDGRGRPPPPAVVEEAPGQRVDLDLVAADPDTRGVVEGERGTEGALPPGERSRAPKTPPGSSG